MGTDLDSAIRSMIAGEVERALGPHLETISRLAAAFGRAPAPQTRRARRNLRNGARRVSVDGRLCALKDCANAARSKGYCAAHYQKYRNLVKTDRLPADWTEHASPGSVADIVLPRGRAAAKALKQKRAKSKAKA